MPSRSDSTRQPPSRNTSTRGKPQRQASSRRDFQPPTRSNTQHERPKPPTRTDTAHSHYVNMLLSQDEIPKWHTVLAAVLVWLLLAGFLVFPGTFTSLQETIDDRNDDRIDIKAGEVFVNTVQNIPLLVVGAVACGIAAIGMVALLIRHRVNFVWLINRLLIPGIVNSIAGLISTLVGVYTQQRHLWSITARVTAIIEGAYLVACTVLFIFYTVKLQSVKKRHLKHYEEGANLKGKTSEERKREIEERKEEAAALEPGGSIV